MQAASGRPDKVILFASKKNTHLFRTQSDTRIYRLAKSTTFHWKFQVFVVYSVAYTEEVGKEEREPAREGKRMKSMGLIADILYVWNLLSLSLAFTYNNWNYIPAVCSIRDGKSKLVAKTKNWVEIYQNKKKDTYLKFVCLLLYFVCLSRNSKFPSLAPGIGIGGYTCFIYLYVCMLYLLAFVVLSSMTVAFHAGDWLLFIHRKEEAEKNRTKPNKQIKHKTTPFWISFQLLACSPFLLFCSL